MSDLNAALIKAHTNEDYDVLIALYRQAGEVEEAKGAVDAACFYFTHAYVFALQEGHSEAVALSAKLAHYGRDVRLD